MNEKAKPIIAKELKEKTGVLDLSYCELDRIPEEIGKMIWLKELYLPGNQISKIEGLGELSNLTELYLYENQISRIEGLQGLSNLKELHIFYNQINKIENLADLKNLVLLDLSGNKVNKLEGLESLSSLEELGLEENQISKIEGLESLSSLVNLSFLDNKIIKIEGLDNMPNLSMLNLDKNQISRLEGFENLPNLRALAVGENKIKNLEGLDYLSNLEILSLHNNEIRKVRGLENLLNLTILSLESNQISKIEGFDNLINLAFLDIERNSVSKLEGLFELPNLKALAIRDNPIGDLSLNEKDFISSLQFCGLSNTKINDISFLYQSIRQGKKILWEEIEPTSGDAPDKENYLQFFIENKAFHLKKAINVKGCTELEPSLIAAIKEGAEALLEYISAQKERLLEARVLVLGEPRAGKTTLRKKLLNVTSPMPRERQSTKAFEIEIEDYECEIEMGEQKEKLRYYLWDFGGQDYYRLLHQLFVTEQSVYIIVVDTDRNKNEEEIAFWLDTIERLGKDDAGHYGPVIVLQNPKNNRPGGSFSDLRKHYSFWNQPDDFVINLNAINKNDEESFDHNELVKFRTFEQYLSKSFCRLDHVGREMPVEWIAVRKALLEVKENWIPVEQFYSICGQEKIESKALRKSLLNIFRQLGYILHYRNTTLKGMVILNREWVTDGLYRVLDDPIVEANKGWFLQEDAEKIWYDEQYENRSIELLALMQEFKLCYQNSVTKKYIVPSKLPTTIDSLPEWDSTNNVRLHLRYDWMPKALAIQLIVSLHEYIVTLKDGEHWIWRKGAVLDGKELDLEGVQVRIRDEYEERHIAIDARGQHSESLIRVVMKKWREVHKPFENKVNVVPIILCPCAECADLDKPNTFKYHNVLKAKQKKKPLQCHESLDFLEAEAILKGIYDETSVLIDTVKQNNRKHSAFLDLIEADNLRGAIEAITSSDYKALFARRLKKLNKESSSGILSTEEQMREHNILAKDLVEYFNTRKWEGGLMKERFADSQSLE